MYNRTFIGLDVHAVSVVGCALVPDTGELVRMQMDSDPAVVLDWIRRFEPPVKAVYESGPTGYVLARFLREAGIDCVVAASSKLLRAPGDRIKTDKRDARLLAEMLALGQVTEVRVPTREQEDLRDLSRLRATAAKNLAHARQHVNAVLLRHGIRYPKETKWTREHVLWLHRQCFDSPVLQFAWEADVEQVELLAAHLKRIDQHVELVARDCEYAEVINALMCLRGIQVTTGFGLAVEIGDWTRFTGASIGSYVGLVPSEQSSGQSRHQGPITKAGNKYTRKLLVEAAWQHRRPYARPGIRLLRQLELAGPATRIRALEGNRRLHHKWEVFDARKKRSVTANTAIARELAGWCWSLATPLQQGEHGQGGRMNAA
ncbi:IS110 family transposase [Arthrobacter sp. SDTb3-6]|uniref:IS110 family transposase n=1 Tax=Arthrobacter sp. SDTb3-6 TaxID=2713571 RepID=UPI00159DB27B|nr:IS110 family transposase [Arthrobacter sp. SDTb3-6]NVN00810.1 IS110 family transposase [Arthrobacter sp. SDTb3-6]